MTHWKAALAAAMIFASATAPAMAQGRDGDDWRISFRNSSTYGVTAFATQRANGSWSNNWLRGRVLPGQNIPMTFGDRTDTRCAVRTRVTFDNGEYFEQSINYCNKSALIVTDETIRSQ
jgi:hypothetical protein